MIKALVISLALFASAPAPFQKQTKQPTVQSRLQNRWLELIPDAFEPKDTHVWHVPLGRPTERQKYITHDVFWYPTSNPNRIDVMLFRYHDFIAHFVIEIDAKTMKGMARLVRARYDHEEQIGRLFVVKDAGKMDVNKGSDWTFD